jgi:hypothetical protein
MRLGRPDGEIVDPDEPDPGGDEQLRRVRSDGDIVGREAPGRPDPRVPGREHDTRHPREVDAGEGLGVDPPLDVAHVHNDARAAEHLDVQGLDRVRAVDEVPRSIDVRPGVDSAAQLAHVRDVAGGEGRREPQRDAGVALVDDHPRPDRDAHVEEAHTTPPDGARRWSSGAPESHAAPSR